MQVLYDNLACKRRDNGGPVYVFWDQKCLNYGQNWEAGFLNGLANSTVLVLLLSQKVNSSKVEEVVGIMGPLKTYLSVSFYRHCKELRTRALNNKTMFY